MKRIRTEARIIQLLSRFKTEIDTAGSMERRDIFLAAEDLIIPLFKIVFGFTHLRNLNKDERVNYPGIDLADDNAGVGIQVTVTNTGEKVKDSLRKFFDYNLQEKYRRLIIYILTEKKASYPAASFKKIIDEKSKIITGEMLFSFDEDRDIWDYNTFVKELKRLDGDQLDQVEQVLESYFDESDQLGKFVGHYKRLREAYIPPSRIIEQVELEQFEGREWLVDEIDDFLRKNERGYFILEAEAGLGKTTFLYWLVQKRDYIHHFVGTTPGQSGIRRGLENLAAQLVVTYQLGTYAAEGVLPSEAAEPDFLLTLLRQAAAERQNGEKIVLAIDALDEAGTPADQNALGLPDVLPEGVFIIVSQRPGAVVLHVDPITTPRQIFRLTAANEHNQSDMRRFLEKAVTWPEIVGALAEGNYAAEQFTTTMLEKCGGVWIYLRFVIGDIKTGRSKLLDLDKLPNGMTQYLARFWGQWRAEDAEGKKTWSGGFLPLLATLAAAQEAIDVERLIEWASVDWSVEYVQGLLDGKFRPFLLITEIKKRRVFRFYHAFLYEFFHGQVDKTNLSGDELTIVEQTATATHRAHKRLAERYLEVWGNDLRSSQTEDLLNLDEGYGLSYFAAHLEAAGSANELDLHSFLQIQWQSTGKRPRAKQDFEGWLDKLLGRRQFESYTIYQNAWYSVKESAGDTDGYLADVQRAWRMATDAYGEALDTVGKDPKSQGELLGHQIRYALSFASINSMAGNIPPDFLVVLIKRGIWSAEQALLYAHQTPNETLKATMLAQMAPHIPERLQAAALRETLALPSWEWEKPLASLMQYLSEELHREVLQAAGNLSDYGRAKTLAVLAPHLSLPLLDEALAIVEIIPHVYRAQSLAYLAPYLPKSLVVEAFSNRSNVEMIEQLAPWLPEPQLQEALDIVQAVDNEGTRSRLVLSLAPHISAPEWPQALRIVEKFKNETLEQVAPFLPDEFLTQAHKIARSMEDKYREKVLAALAARVAQLGDVQQALSMADGLNSDWNKGDALVRIAPYLPQERQSELLKTAQKIKDKNARASTLARLVPYLSDPLQKQAVHQALSTAPRSYSDKITMVGERPNILRTLAPNLPPSMQQEALNMALDLKDGNQRSMTLLGLAHHLDEPHRETVVQEMLNIASTSQNQHFQWYVLNELAPYLSEKTLREALIATRSIGSQAALARAYHYLANYLPQVQRDEWLGEALAVAREVQVNGTRARGLAELAPHLPSPLRDKVWREALANATGLSESKLSESDNEQARTLVAILPSLPKRLQQEAVQALLKMAKNQSNKDAQTQAQVALFAYLPETEHLETLGAAWDEPDAKEKAKMLTYLAPHLKGPEKQQVVQEAFAAVAAIEAKPDICDFTASARLEGLESLTPQLSEPLLTDALATVEPASQYDGHASLARAALARRLTELKSFERALALARSIPPSLGQAFVLASLLPHLPESMRNEAVEQALPEIPAIRFPAYRITEDQVEAYLRLVPYLADQLKTDTLRTAALIVANSRNGAGISPLARGGRNWWQDWQYRQPTKSRTMLLAELATPLASLPAADLFDIWQVILPILARRTRDELLEDIGALAPVIATLGGATGVKDSLDAIQSVVHWWP